MFWVAETATQANGKKGADDLRKNHEIVQEHTGLYDQPHFLVARDIMSGIVNAFLAERFDRVLICRPHFVNTMTQHFIVEPVLPLVQEEIVEEAKPEEKEKAYDIYMVEPSAESIATGFLARLLTTQMHRAIIETACCEFAARMVAMDLATDNAQDMIIGNKHI